MRHLLLPLLLGVSVGLLGCRNGHAPDEPDPGPPVAWSPDMQAVADGNNRFALDLYARLREKPGNVFFSPYSVHAALAMTADGANGTTRDQMVKVLHLPPDREKALAAGDLGPYYSAGSRSYELAVANSLWGRTGFPWRPDFLDRQKERFGAGFHEADFAANPEGERARINAWVEEKTRDKIKELLVPRSITKRTTMVLVNAIYFKGQWVTRFDKARTRDEPFYLADGTAVPVSLMHQSTDSGRYGRFDDTQVLELPYRGGDLAMVVILPPKAGGLPALEQSLTTDRLAGWLAGLREVKDLDVSLPRFQLTWGSELLNEPLRALGMTEAFGDADFTGMATASPGSISGVYHKAFVDVNEEGTEATAATAVVIKESALPSFRADRPFLFLIRDVRHGTILFLGRYEKPCPPGG